MVNMETAETADNDIGNEEDRIKEVWSHNLEEEFKNICRVVQVLRSYYRVIRDRMGYCWQVLGLHKFFLLLTTYLIHHLFLSPIE